MNQHNSIIKEDCLEIIKYLRLTPFRNKDVLITGASGLLGQYIFTTIALANKYQNLNTKVTCATLHGPTPFEKSFLPDRHIKFVKADLAKHFDLGKKFDYIFHAAGYGQPFRFLNDPFSSIAINVYATDKLLQSAMN